MINYLNINNQSLPYLIISKNNKNTYFRFKKDYLEINKSIYMSEKEVLNYLTNNFNTFYSKYIKLVNSIPNELEIILNEKSYQVKIINNQTFNYELLNNEIIVYTKIKDLNKIKYLVYEAHLKKMMGELREIVLNVLNKNDIKELPYRFGHFKTKFGSYHRFNKEITLNVILAKANINYLYYVLMHEYAHTKVFDHSNKFYKVLQELMPNYLTYQKTIKKLSIWI